MHKGLVYVSSDNVHYDLGSPSLSVGAAEEIRSRVWSINLGINTLISTSRPAREVDITIKSINPLALDAAEVAFDRDVSLNSPGKLVSPDGWSQQAYITKTVPSNIFLDNVVAKLTVILLDGVWRKEVKHVLKPDTQALISGSGLDYPHDFDFDLGGSIPGKDMDFIRDSKVRITFFGPCQDPYVRIGSNLYGVKGVTVAAGERVVIDPTLLGEYGRAIRLVGTYGAERNLFSKRIRGAKGSGSYAFEPVAGGYLPVSWPQTYGLDIDEIRERGGLPWS
ncbi:MAG: hypothetical protein KIC37_05070 [Coriobacteriaceae bacterium]|nr:hypothetical protein [Coriobacteriaceae bacterium]